MRGAVCSSYVFKRFWTTSGSSSGRLIISPWHLSHLPSIFGMRVLRLKISPQFLQVTLEDSLLMIISFGTFMFIARSMSVISDSISACGIVRGNPSRMNPFLQSSFSIRSFSISITILSGTSSPLSIYPFACSPISVLCFRFSLNRSPVEM